MCHAWTFDVTSVIKKNTSICIEIRGDSKEPCNMSPFIMPVIKKNTSIWIEIQGYSKLPCTMSPFIVLNKI